MLRRHVYLATNQTKATVMTPSSHNDGINMVWVATLAAAVFAGVFCFFSFFFGSSGWRVLSEG